MKTIFSGIVGSHAHGTNTEGSDQDIASIYICDIEDLMGFKYKEHDDEDKDNRRYEVGKFIKLLMNGNPNMLELLFLPDDCILLETEEWQLIKAHRDSFITKNLFNTFIGYGKTQIEKAKGLNKKINWEESSVERKGVLDFCYVLPEDGIPLLVKEWLKKEGFNQEECALSLIEHFRYTYKLYHDKLKWLQGTNHRYKDVATNNFNGIVRDEVENDDVCVSVIPKGLTHEGILYFNRDGYSVHCKLYREYSDWLRKRNENRYNTNKAHGQKYDSKNILHLVRLLNTAEDIVNEKKVVVRRPSQEINYLLTIKRGEVDLGNIVKKAQDSYPKLKELFLNSNLPESADEEFCHELLVQIRNYKIQC